LSSKKRYFVALAERLRHEHPEVPDPVAAIAAGRVVVNGAIVVNPRGLVPRHGTITISGKHLLRGTVKLRAALVGFRIPVASRIALDVGASTGGFTSALLEAGARRVYAVDAGHGQLLGSLRQDERVVNLERTNLGALTPATITDRIEILAVDLSYLPVGEAIPQLEVMRFGSSADLVALVKPMFELRRSTPPTDEAEFKDALRFATSGIERAPWTMQGSIRSPVPGQRGAVEFLVHARRR
jgi:23S rRNA (cytidine1920-2'-O)/16S rRNA (cytidine1409-2'-O)-methyltransferase